jgi:succinate dehydrogenase / fumarate reductase cytochrome b subunit
MGGFFANCVDIRAHSTIIGSGACVSIPSSRASGQDKSKQRIRNRTQGLEIHELLQQGWKNFMNATVRAEVLPRKNRAVTFWQSTNGKKVVMAITGAMMFLFIIGHLLGNLLIFISPAKLDAYASFLHFDDGLLWLVRSILIAAIVLHILATVQLGMRSWKARPIGYSRKEAINSSYASRTMYWSGPIVLAFIIFHLLEFTSGTIHPNSTFIPGAVYHNVVAGFQVWWVSAWYIFAITLLGFHLRHGLWSMFQSVGLAHPRHTQTLKRAAFWIATLIVLGYISIPISILLGFVK